MNNRDTKTRHDGEEPAAPQKLVAALREPPARRVFVPPTVDEAVLRAARQHLNRPQRSGFGWSHSWLVWLATATACLLLIGLIYFFTKPTGKTPGFALEDINHDGRVDILDAFQLARQLQTGVKPAPGLDLNGDGVVDQRDAALLAAHAVKLEKGGRS
jgi:Dockerin type I domain